MKKIEKLIGETPKEAIERFRNEFPEYASEKIAYAGRLDPLASGQMLLLIGEECKKRDEFQALDKEYEFEILLGFRTDSYDVLGLPEFNAEINSSISLGQVEKFINQKVGKSLQKFPVFSSKTLNGIPLRELYKRGNLVLEEIPEKEINIYEIKLLENRFDSAHQIKEKIRLNILLVKGNFRQSEVLEKWEEIFEKLENSSKFQILKFSAKVSSGTYIRSLANEFGNLFGVYSLAFSINRTKI